VNSQPYYASKKIVIQSSDFPVRRTGSYCHKKALLGDEWTNDDSKRASSAVLRTSDHTEHCQTDQRASSSVIWRKTRRYEIQYRRRCDRASIETGQCDFTERDSRQSLVVYHDSSVRRQFIRHTRAYLCDILKCLRPVLWCAFWRRWDCITRVCVCVCVGRGLVSTRTERLPVQRTWHCQAATPSWAHSNYDKKWRNSLRSRKSLRSVHISAINLLRQHLLVKYSSLLAIMIEKKHIGLPTSLFELHIRVCPLRMLTTGRWRFLSIAHVGMLRIGTSGVQLMHSMYNITVMHKISYLVLENVAIATHCNLRPPDAEPVIYRFHWDARVKFEVCLSVLLHYTADTFFTLWPWTSKCIACDAIKLCTKLMKSKNTRRSYYDLKGYRTTPHGATLSYNVRRRSHCNKSLITKTADLSNNDYIIRATYKDSCWHYYS